MGVTTEDFKEFIDDEKYAGVREYLLSAFKRIDMLTDKFLNGTNDHPYNNYEKHEWLNNLIEDIAETAVLCIELLERAYVD